MDSTSSSPLRIAIVGGGLCGLTVANALVHYRDLHGEDPALPLEVRVYEAKPELAERGANVGLSGNAKRALRDCVPNADLMLAEAGAVHMVSTCIMLVSLPGPQSPSPRILPTCAHPGHARRT